MKRNSEYELKLHELGFMMKKYEIHNKIHNEASEQFSDYFKTYIESISDRSKRHKLEKIAGLVGEEEKLMTKTAKRAKQSGQYRRGRHKINKPHQEDAPLPPPPPNKKVPKEYKSLYRKVASAIHPDKVSGDLEKQKMLQEVNGAISTGEYFKIVECAVKLNIEIPEEVPLNVSELDTKIEGMKKKIKDMTKSVAWEWYHIEGEDSKVILIQKYAEYLVKTQ
jgi:hypothetical protein